MNEMLVALYLTINILDFVLQLDEDERDNILKATRWALKSRNLKKDYPTDISLKLLHKK